MVFSWNYRISKSFSENQWWKHTKPRLLAREGRLLKPRPIREGVCALCEKKDLVFPVNIDVCPACAKKIIERRDVPKMVQYRRNYNKHVCIVCRRETVGYWRINTYICNKCTFRLGKSQARIRKKKK